MEFWRRLYIIVQAAVYNIIAVGYESPLLHSTKKVIRRLIHSIASFFSQ